MEFGLAPDYAYQLAARAYGWLRSLENAPNVDIPALWPTPDTWLAIDRGASWQAEMDANFTLTSNLVFIAVGTGRWPSRGTYAASPAHWMHDRIADHAGQLAKELGFWVLAPFVRARLRAALNGFDAPYSVQLLDLDGTSLLLVVNGRYVGRGEGEGTVTAEQGGARSTRIESRASQLGDHRAAGSRARPAGSARLRADDPIAMARPANSATIALAPGAGGRDLGWPWGEGAAVAE